LLRANVRGGKSERGGQAKSWPRPSPANPGRVKPKGGSGDRWTKHPRDLKGLREGTKPRNRGSSGRLGASAAGTLLSETVRGCFRAETHRIPSWKGNLRRVNPRSAAGMKQDRQGTEGSKPSRG